MIGDVDVLIVGAGPNGLATAAYAAARGLSTRIIGEPMGFWKHNMPPRMLLRSGVDWHLDPLGIHTFAAYLRERSLDPEQVTPIPVQLFLDYAGWFQAKKRIDVVQDLVVSLRAGGSGFEAELARGGRIAARNVVIATGCKDYKFIPLDIVADLPSDRYAHTCDLVEFSFLRGKRCLIVGGRQGAFEWAALINEESAAEVHVVYRHDTPHFEPSDWSWIDRHVDEMLGTPGWYRGLSEPDRQAVDQHFWEEAKLKLEPWLWDRLGHDGILSWPRRTVSNCSLAPGGQIDVSLDNGSRLRVDFVVLATGYHVDIARLPLLEDTSILPRIQTAGGYPVLDDAFQSTLPGMYFAGLASTRDFGPMFGFVRGCTATARLIVDHLVA
jgi:cation diffusion facilitator CzcD-associated flavoprotein CzcO